jgi:hypothetical protein
MDRFYRKEIPQLKTAFFQKVKGIPTLAMSATLPGKRKRTLEAMFDIEFDRANSGNMDKRTMSYEFDAKSCKYKRGQLRRK